MSEKYCINGVLLLNKELGVSSNFALQRVKRLYQAKKAGHTGTLDPLATGLLPICFGDATKFSGYLLDASKEYIADIQLGVTTTTYDSEGEIVNCIQVNIDIETIQSTISKFMGEIIQIPPIYSALKVDGKPLYKYARESIDVVIKPRLVNIYELEILDFSPLTSKLKLRVLASKGTYIRSLAHDIGQSIGCGASLCGLMRTKSSNFNVDNSYTIKFIEGLEFKQRSSILLPVDSMLLHLPYLNLCENQSINILHGKPIVLSIEQTNYTNKCLDDIIRIYHNGKFLGLAKLQGEILVAHRLIAFKS